MSINGLSNSKLKRVGCCRYKPQNLKFNYETALSEVVSPNVTSKPLIYLQTLYYLLRQAALFTGKKSLHSEAWLLLMYQEQQFSDFP